MVKGFDALPARFYTTVDVAPAEGGGFAVQLDGRVPKSPKKSPLILPTQALASLIEPDRMLESVPGIDVRGGRWWVEPGAPDERFNPGFAEPDWTPPPAP